MLQYTNMEHIFIAFIYQPFLNILVGIYWLLNLLPRGHADMGVAVIIFTVIIRILLLPLTFSGERSEKERREIGKKVKELEVVYAGQPITLQHEVKKLLHKNARIIFSELVTLFIQIMIALMLWRIFAKGLPGEDLHLIYSWMPDVAQPFNLVFLGKYDLTHPHLILNIIQSLLIAVLETLDIVSSPYPISRKEVVRLELTLPIASFLIFMFLPAGKKLFVITTLIFSIVYKLFRITKRFVTSLSASEGEKGNEVIPVVSSGAHVQDSHPVNTPSHHAH